MIHFKQTSVKFGAIQNAKTGTGDTKCFLILVTDDANTNWTCEISDIIRKLLV